MNEEMSRFIEAWGSMGMLWGINRSMARVHALILLSGEPVELDRVATELDISRGNASMSLKELRNWGVIQRVHISGDRRDFYVAEPDNWKMFFRIATERKRREFDPALDVLRGVLASGEWSRDDKVYQRMSEMEEIFSTFNRIMNKFLEDEKKSKTMLSFFKTFTPKDQ